MKTTDAGSIDDNRGSYCDRWSARTAADAAVPWLAWSLIALAMWSHGALALGIVVAGMTSWAHRRRFGLAWKLVVACVVMGGLVELLLGAIPDGTELARAPALRGVSVWVTAAASYELVSRIGARIGLLRVVPFGRVDFAVHVSCVAAAILVASTTASGGVPHIAAVVASSVALGRGSEDFERDTAGPQGWLGWSVVALATLALVGCISILVNDRGFLLHAFGQVLDAAVEPNEALAVSFPLLSLVLSTAVAVVLLARAGRRAGAQRATRVWLAQRVAGWLLWAGVSSLGAYAVLVATVPRPPEFPGQCPDGGVPPDGMDC